MKKNMLCLAVVASMAVASSAMAQDFDDRWFVTGDVGINFQDHDRGTQDIPMIGLGFGKFISPEWSFEFGVNHQNPAFTGNGDLNFSQFGATFDVKRHFRGADRNWWPYLKAGLGFQRAEEEFDAFPSPNSPGQREQSSLATELGLGMQAEYTNHSLRFEGGVRIVADDQSVVNPSSDNFADFYVKAGVIVPLGAKAAPPAPPAPVAPPAPPAPTCADLDDDGDGVNNCDDKCPDSQAGQAIGADGCAVALSIDLKGVNFDFDKTTLRPDATAILDEAIVILKRYPQLRVEVAGHTDSVGPEAYNQKLSEGRARAAYDYLVANGISADRLVGPNGYGENSPLDTNDTREGRARNRRTELNVQN